MFCFRLISVPDYLTATRKLTPQAQLMQSWTRCFHHRWRGSSFWHRKCRNRICNPHQHRHQPMMPAVKSLSICAKRKTALCQQHTCRIHFASGQIARTLWQTVISRWGHYICSCESGICRESLFGLWHAHHWSQKSNDQVIGDDRMLKAESQSRLLAATGFYMPQWTILFELELIS